MFNLIETQQALKGLPLPDVMKYANGNNPTVPSYLALSELQRRKQIEDTSAAFYGQPPTVKEQIESGLTALPQGQVNPTQAPQGVNPTAMPPQLAPSPNMPPPMANPTAAPAGVQPNAAPPRMMAEGGLSNLPLPHMFRQTSYADGGIVYFDEGTGDKTVEEARKEQLASDRGALINNLKKFGAASMDVLTLPGRGLLGAVNSAVIRPARAITGADIPYIAGDHPEILDSMTPFYDQIRKAEEAKAKQDAKPVQKADSGVYDREDAAAGAVNKVKPTAVPPNPNTQASNTSSALITQPTTAKPPTTAEFKSQFDTSKMGKLQTPEEVYAEKQGIKALTGVSDDPMKDIKERYAKLEAKRAGQEAQDPYDNLMARLSSFAQAKPTSGFGVQMAASSDAGQKLQKEQEALRDKQATEMNALQAGIAKEDDARKRGDAKGIEDAIAKQKDAQFKLYELVNQEKTAAATWENAQTNKAKLPFEEMAARAHLVQAQRGHAPNAIQSLEALYKTNPDLAKMYLGQGKVGTMTLEEAYKAVATDPKNMGLTDAQKQQKATELHRWAAGQNVPKTMTMADVKTTAKNSGKSEQEVMDMAKKNGYTIQ